MKTYLFAIVVLCSACAGYRAQDFHNPSKLSAPDGVYVSSISGQQITLTWNASRVEGGSGAVTTYVVYRNGRLIGSVPGSTTSYEDRTVWPLTDYSYQIAALSGDGGRSKLSYAVAVQSLSDYVTDDSGNVLVDVQGNRIIAR